MRTRLLWIGILLLLSVSPAVIDAKEKAALPNQPGHQIRPPETPREKQPSSPLPFPPQPKILIPELTPQPKVYTPVPLQPSLKLAPIITNPALRQKIMPPTYPGKLQSKPSLTTPLPKLNPIIQQQLHLQTRPPKLGQSPIPPHNPGPAINVPQPKVHNPFSLQSAPPVLTPKQQVPSAQELLRGQ